MIGNAFDIYCPNISRDTSSLHRWSEMNVEDWHCQYKKMNWLLDKPCWIHLNTLLNVCWRLYGWIFSSNIIQQFEPTILDDGRSVWTPCWMILHGVWLVEYSLPTSYNMLNQQCWMMVDPLEHPIEWCCMVFGWFNILFQHHTTCWINNIAWWRIHSNLYLTRFTSVLFVDEDVPFIQGFSDDEPLVTAWVRRWWQVSKGLILRWCFTRTSSYTSRGEI